MTSLNDWMAELKRLNTECECYGEGDELLFEYSNQRCDSCIAFLEEARNALPVLRKMVDLADKQFGGLVVMSGQIGTERRTLRAEFQRILDESEKA